MGKKRGMRGRTREKGKRTYMRGMGKRNASRNGSDSTIGSEEIKVPSLPEHGEENNFSNK